MSWTTILAITPGEGFAELSALKNSWQSAMLVWDAVWERYGQKRHEHDIALLAGDRLWALYDDPRLEPFERAVFGITFDRWYIAKADYARAASDIAAFMARHNVGGHWVAIRELLASDPEHQGIGFWWTSVAENPFCGEWDDGAEEYGPTDWDRVTNAYVELAMEAQA